MTHKKYSFFLLVAVAGLLFIAKYNARAASNIVYGTETAELKNRSSFLHEALNSNLLPKSEEQIELLSRVKTYFDNEKRILEGELADRNDSDAVMNRQLGEELLVSYAEESTQGTLNFLEPQEGSITDPINVYALKSHILLKVITGDEERAFSVHEVNVSQRGDGVRAKLPCLKNGVTYILLKLDEVPDGNTKLNIEAVPFGQTNTAHWGRVWLKADSERGFLQLSVRNERGADVPALVRIKNLENGTLWEPPNAIDLGPIMTKITNLPIYGPGRGYTYFLPGEMRGPYWIVPGAFEMTLPTGKWSLNIYRGPEYDYVKEEFIIEPDTTTQHTVSLNRWTDLREEGWYSGDDHVHARVMSDSDAKNVITWAKAADIHVANVLEMGNASRSWYEQRGFGREFRVQEEDFVLVPGQEDPRAEFGHIIGLNLKEMARDEERYVLYSQVHESIKEQGGLYGQTHGGEGFLGVEKDLAMGMPFGRSDFISIMQNVLGTSLYYDFLNLGFKMTASAGSDTPYGGAVGITRLYAHIDGEFTADKWFDAVKNGHTFVTNGPIVSLVVNDRYRPGDEILIEEPTRITVQVKASGIQGLSAPVRAALIWNGEEVEVFNLAGPTEVEISGSLPLEISHGGWLALRADGINGSQAHTSPIYIKRNGFRHWNPKLAPKLIDKYRSVLDETQRKILSIQEKYEENQLAPLDDWNIPIAQNAEALLNEISSADSYFQELLTTLEKEEAQGRDTE